MYLTTFEELYEVLKPSLLTVLCQFSNCTHAPNGVIHPSTRLACSIRIFSGSDPYDLISVYGISKTVLHDILWQVVDAVNMCEELQIKSPTNMKTKLTLPKGFSKFPKPKYLTVVELLMVC